MNGSPSCPVCAAGQQRPLEKINLEEQHLLYAPADSALRQQLTREAEKSAASYQMLRCERCRLEFAWPLRSPPATWYAAAYGALNLYPESRWEFQFCLQALNEGDTVFEFGCGIGVFMRLCVAEGIHPVGVDFSTTAVESCRKKGLKAFELEIKTALPQEFRQCATQVVAFHLLEHLDEPRVLFERAAEVARQGARFWVAVPSERRLTRQRGLVDFLDQPPHHMTRWNQSALEKVGQTTGWMLTRIQHEPMRIKTALWSIATTGASYCRWRDAGRLKSRFSERVLRFARYPGALLRRATVDRHLTGFSLLACFIRA